jgi:hypothetical protein
MIMMDLISVLFGMAAPNLRKTSRVIAMRSPGARGDWVPQKEKRPGFARPFFG